MKAEAEVRPLYKSIKCEDETLRSMESEDISRTSSSHNTFEQTVKDDAIQEQSLLLI